MVILKRCLSIIKRGGRGARFGCNVLGFVAMSYPYEREEPLCVFQKIASRMINAENPSPHGFSEDLKIQRGSSLFCMGSPVEQR